MEKYIEENKADFANKKAKFSYFEHDISGGFSSIDHRGYPLSIILQGNKQ